jgi:hypothetical protein
VGLQAQTRMLGPVFFFLFKGADNFFFLIKKGKKTCNSFVADNVSFVSLESSHHNNGWKIKHMSVFTQKNSFLTHFNHKNTLQILS